MSQAGFRWLLCIPFVGGASGSVVIWALWLRGWHLLSKGRELEDVERLVETGGVLVDVDHHWHTAGTTEEELQEVGELGLSERNVMLEPAVKIQVEPAVLQWSKSVNEKSTQRDGEGTLRAGWASKRWCTSRVSAAIHWCFLPLLVVPQCCGFENSVQNQQDRTEQAWPQSRTSNRELYLWNRVKGGVLTRWCPGLWELRRRRSGGSW